MTAPEDVELLARLRARDERAYAQVLSDHGSWMLGLAKRILGGDESEAEDAVQDACLSAFRSVDRFEGNSRLTTWLHRIVVNAALMRLRSRRRRAEATEPALPAVRLDGPSPLAAEWREAPLTALHHEEVRAAVRRAVEELPAPYRSVFVLRDVEGLPIEDVAQLLGLGVPGTKSRLHRARQTLRESLGSLFEETDADRRSEAGG